MKVSLIALVAFVLFSTTAVLPVSADEKEIDTAVFNDLGELVLPEGYRTWVFVGAPLTPNGLNNGQAAFPEFHHVYINPDAYAVYERTGTFPEGTVIAKELALLQQGDYPDGSKNSASGRGYFAGEFNGMAVMVKDSERFSATGDWGFFNFGHRAPPYDQTAVVEPKASCASCHQANAAKEMVFTNMYPLLRQQNNSGQ